MKKVIELNQFMQCDIRIGTIQSVDTIDGADKLVKLIVNIGDAERQLVAGIREVINDLDTLVGMQIPVLVNLEPRVIKGVESQGMILAADDDGKPVLLHPVEKVPSGSTVR